MDIHMKLKEIMGNHKEKIELTQWAIISGVTSLIYSEYISKMRQKTKPVPIVFIPEIKTLQELLRQDGHFMKMLSDQLLDQMLSSKLFQKYLHAPELILFAEDIQCMNIILDLYIIPNISRRVPESVMIKFGLNNPQQQTFRESPELDLFYRKPINENHVEFMADQSILQLLLLMPTVEKDVEIPEENSKIHMSETEILTIGNEKAICPVHFNDDILSNEYNKAILDLLKFVTSTEIHEMDPNLGIQGKKSDDSYIKYTVKTSPFNTVALTNLKGIVTGVED